MRLRDIVDETPEILLPDNNMVMNGNFDVWQRNSYFEHSSSIVNRSWVATADRWLFAIQGIMGGNTRIEKNTNPVYHSWPDSSYSRHCIRVRPLDTNYTFDSTAIATICHPVEGHHAIHMFHRGATLSFWVRTTKPGIYHVSFRNRTATRSFQVPYPINDADTWEKKIVHIPLNIADVGEEWNRTNGIGISLNFVLHATGNAYSGMDPFQWRDNHWLASNVQQVNFFENATTNDNFMLSQVKLEPGRRMTPFTPPNYIDELRRCERYHERVHLTHKPIVATGVTTLWCNYEYRTAKRATPSISVGGPKYWNWGASQWTTIPDNEFGSRVFITPSAKEMMINLIGHGCQPYETHLMEMDVYIHSELQPSD